MQDNRLMSMPAVERGLDRPLTDLNPVRSYGPAASEPNQIRDYLFVVLKRKWLILSLCLVVTSLVAVQMFRQPSIYEAEATIRIEQRTQNEGCACGCTCQSGCDCPAPCACAQAK